MQIYFDFSASHVLALPPAMASFLLLSYFLSCSSHTCHTVTTPPSHTQPVSTLGSLSSLGVQEGCREPISFPSLVRRFHFFPCGWDSPAQWTGKRGHVSPGLAHKTLLHYLPSPTSHLLAGHRLLSRELRSCGMALAEDGRSLLWQAAC